MSDCDKLRDKALEEGPAAVTTDPALREHLGGCNDCQQFMDEYWTLTRALGAVPRVDAPDAVVAETERRVRSAAPVDPLAEARAPGPAQTVRWPKRRAWKWPAAAAAVVAVGVLVAVMQPAYQDFTTRPDISERVQQGSQFPLASRVAEEKGLMGRSRELLAVLEAPAPEPAPPLPISDGESLGRGSELAQYRTDADRQAGAERAPAGKHEAAKRAPPGRFGKGALSGTASGDASMSAQSAAVERDLRALERRYVDVGKSGTDDFASRIQRRAKPAPAREANETARGAARRLEAKESDEAEDSGSSLQDEQRDGASMRAPDAADDLASATPEAALPASIDKLALLAPLLKRTPGTDAEPGNRALAEPRSSRQNRQGAAQSSGQGSGAASGTIARARTVTEAFVPSPPDPRTAGADRRSKAARSFLSGLERVENLSFAEPRGYWRNTYIPGDPAMRLLRTRLGLFNRIPGIGDAGLERAVRANHQPLDVPDNAGMALYLQADKAAVSGPQRVRIQVGLQGALRSGSRPTMNVSVVVDLSDPSRRPGEAEVRAIVSALAAARQPGDRFTLSAAGGDGGLLVNAGDFRHGPLQVALARLFANGTPAGAQPHDLLDAVQIAAGAAHNGDAPGAAFGSSLVLLITAGIDGSKLPPLETLVHRNALQGIALSVVDTSRDGVLGIGSAPLMRLVAAGQGQRRALPEAGEAEHVVAAELRAASRAVARAARLRIRLARGVRLLEVVGAQRLAEPQAERVREAEQSIDQRLARNLGITADRGEDEDGIQIVIPSFYASDSHVILLDVLVRGPGPVADVILRYKDLVQLENGVARAELRLPSGNRAAGPLQRNVLKNRVAFELATAARAASGELARGQTRRAIDILLNMRDLLAGLREAVSGWSSDPELIADAALIADYVDHLQRNRTGDPLYQRYAVESLRYAAFRKLAPANEELQR